MWTTEIQIKLRAVKTSQQHREAKRRRSNLLRGIQGFAPFWRFATGQRSRNTFGARTAQCSRFSQSLGHLEWWASAASWGCAFLSPLQTCRTSPSRGERIILVLYASRAHFHPKRRPYGCRSKIACRDTFGKLPRTL